MATAGGGGIGSTLVARAREAALRAKTANALGITPYRPGAATPSVASVPARVAEPHTTYNQPVQPPAADEEGMLAHVEDFLGSLNPSKES